MIVNLSVLTSLLYRNNIIIKFKYLISTIKLISNFSLVIFIVNIKDTIFSIYGAILCYLSFISSKLTLLQKNPFFVVNLYNHRQSAYKRLVFA